MKITNITTRLMRIPFTEFLRAAYGGRSHASYLLVTLETDEGLTGYGEHDGLFYETADAFIHSELKPLLLGEDPLQIEFLNHKLEHFLTWNTFAAYPMAAVDMALYDLKGKKLGVPVYQLLGGLYREKMATTGLIHMHGVEEDVASAVKLKEQGCQVLKIKVGFDLHQDLERMAAIRDAVGPKIPFRIDPNMAWSPRTAVRWIRRMEKFNLQWVEQPVPAWDVKGMLEVARAVDTPLSADEGCMSVRDALVLAESGAVEAFNVYLTESGGITRVREIVAIANTAGIACVIGTWGEGGVGQAAVLHLVASSRNFEHASDTAYGLVADDYITRRFTFDSAAGLTVPHGPGLGVELDPAKVERYSKLEGQDRVFTLGSDPRFIPRSRMIL
ncbi:MAG: mandelate racemase/muconate lactonizing enzyme family protein [Acidobacteriota bacterium]